MSRSLLLVVMWTAGCDKVFGLETRSPDAGVPIDARNLIDAPPVTEYIGPGDYDGDGLPNATDGCPLLANQDDANADADALPDACDPDVGDLGRDCIVLFDAWTHARPLAIDPLWVGRAAPWLVGTCDGSNRALCQPVGSPAVFYANADLSVARVEIEMRIANRISDQSRVLVFVNLAPDLPDVSGRGCGLGGNMPIAAHGLVTINRGVLSNTIVGGALGFEDDDDVTLSLSTVGVCTARNDATSATATTTDFSAPPPAGNLIGVHTVDATAHLHYILAYGKTCR